MGNSNIIIKVKTTGILNTPAIESYAREKVGSLEKFLPHYTHESGELVFEVEVGKTTEHHKRGDVFRAEINFTAGRIHFRSEAEKDDLYAAIDEAKDEMQRELRRNKNKHIQIARHGGAKLKELLKRWYR